MSKSNDNKNKEILNPFIKKASAYNGLNKEFIRQEISQHGTEVANAMTSFDDLIKLEKANYDAAIELIKHNSDRVYFMDRSLSSFKKIAREDYDRSNPVVGRTHNGEPLFSQIPDVIAKMIDDKNHLLSSRLLELDANSILSKFTNLDDMLHKEFIYLIYHPLFREHALAFINTISDICKLRNSSQVSAIFLAELIKNESSQFVHLLTNSKDVIKLVSPESFLTAMTYSDVKRLVDTTIMKYMHEHIASLFKTPDEFINLTKVNASIAKQLIRFQPQQIWNLFGMDEKQHLKLKHVSEYVSRELENITPVKYVMGNANPSSR